MHSTHCVLLRASKVKVAATEESAPEVALAGSVNINVYVALFAVAPVNDPPFCELHTVPIGVANEPYDESPLSAPLYRVSALSPPTLRVIVTCSEAPRLDAAVDVPVRSLQRTMSVRSDGVVTVDSLSTVMVCVKVVQVVDTGLPCLLEEMFK